MGEETKLGQEWIESAIRLASSIDDIEIQWEQDVKSSSYHVRVVTPEGKLDTERIRRQDIDDCADYHNPQVRRRINRQVCGLLLRLGISK